MPTPFPRPRRRRPAAGLLLPALLTLLGAVATGPGPRASGETLGGDQAAALPDTLRYTIGASDAVDRFSEARAVAGSQVDSSYFAVDAGNHRLLHLKVDGSLLWQRGDFGAGEGQLNRPIALALDEANRLYVLEAGNRRISVFDAVSGDFFETWPAPADPARAWLDPVDIAASKGGAVYLLDRARGQVLRYSSRGEILGSFGTPGSGAGQMSAPRGIAVAPDSSVWIADAGNGRLLRFSARGLLLGTHGSPGRGAGQFEGLQDVTVAGSGAVLTAESDPASEWTRIQHLDETLTPFTSWGNGEFKSLASIGISAGNSVFVADPADNSFQRFSLTGEFDHRLGGDHETVGKIGSATGLDLARDGRLIYLADSRYHRIRRFDVGGILRDSFGDGGTEDAGHLNQPGDVAVAPDGTVYVADTGNRRLQRFGASGAAPTVFRLSADGMAAGPVPRVAIDLPAGGGEPLLFAADPANHRVLRLSRTGQDLGAFGKRAEPGAPADGSFLDLSGLAFSSGRLHAADRAAGRVQTFDAGGAFQGAYGSPEAGPGELRAAAGVTVDALGRSWVADPLAGRVQVFDAGGRPLGSVIDRQGLGLAPEDLAVAPDGRAFLLDRSKRILVYGRGPSAAWRVEFYQGRDLTGPLLNVQETPQVNFNWSTGRPAPGVPDDDFSARAVGFTSQAQDGELRAFVRAQGGVRVWIGGKLALDAWDAAAVDEDLIVDLPAGTHRVELTYRDSGAAAGLSLLNLPPLDVTPEPTEPTATPGSPPGPVVGRLALPWLGSGR